MDTNKDALEVLQVFIQLREHLTNHPLSGSGRVTYNCALDCLLRNVDTIYESLQTQAELVEALKFAQFALEPWDDVKPRDWKSDRENLKRAHQKIKQALARAEEQA